MGSGWRAARSEYPDHRRHRYAKRLYQGRGRHGDQRRRHRRGSGAAVTDAGFLTNAGSIGSKVTVAGGGRIANTGTINAGSAGLGVTLLAGGLVDNVSISGVIADSGQTS